MIMWSELDYELQVKVMDLVEDLLLNQNDPSLQEGIAAALAELEIWSNSICEVISDDPIISEAVEQEFNND